MSAVIPSDTSLADINHDLQSAVVDGDFGGRVAKTSSQTGKSPSCAFHRTPSKPNPAF